MSVSEADEDTPKMRYGSSPCSILSSLCGCWSEEDGGFGEEGRCGNQRMLLLQKAFPLRHDNNDNNNNHNNNRPKTGWLLCWLG